MTIEPLRQLLTILFESLSTDERSIYSKVTSLNASGFQVFTLEVTSPGIDRPLTLPRHFAKNVTRLLKITKNDGEVVNGRITTNTEFDVTLTILEKKTTSEVTVLLADIKRAVVEIEFNRKDEI